MDCLISGLAGLSSQMGCQMWASGPDMHAHTLTHSLQTDIGLHTYTCVLYRDVDAQVKKKPSLLLFGHLSVVFTSFFSPSLSCPPSVLLSLCLCPHALLVSQCNYQGRGTDQGVYTPGCLHAPTHMLSCITMQGIKHAHILVHIVSHNERDKNVVQNVHAYPQYMKRIVKTNIYTQTHGEEHTCTCTECDICTYRHIYTH